MSGGAEPQMNGGPLEHNSVHATQVNRKKLQCSRLTDVQDSSAV
jgi:hypothetical protein